VADEPTARELGEQVGRALSAALVDSLVKAVAKQLGTMHPEATHFVLRPDGSYRPVTTRLRVVDNVATDPPTMTR
jgi:hypothetical protein